MNCPRCATNGEGVWTRNKNLCEDCKELVENNHKNWVLNKINDDPNCLHWTTQAIIKREWERINKEQEKERILLTMNNIKHGRK